MKGIFHQSKLQIILEILIFTVAFSIPISFAFTSISIAALFLFSFVFFNVKLFIKSINKKEVYGYYFLSFLIQVLSLFYANKIEIALEAVKQNTIFLVMPITFINLKNQIEIRKYKAAYLGLFISVFLTLMVSILVLTYKSLTSEMVLSDFFRESFINSGLYNGIHVPYLSILIVFVLICTEKFTFSQKKNINNLLKAGAIFVLFTSLLFLSGVMSLVLLIVYLSVLFLTNKLSNQVKIGTVIVAMFFPVFSFNYIKQYKEMEHTRGSEHVAYRIQKLITSKDAVRQTNWESVIKVISSKPIFGVSADGGLEQLQKERNIISEPYINKHNAHNDTLEITLRYGLVGLMIYLVLIFKLFKNAWQKKLYVFKWFLIVFVVSSITESYLQRQIGLTFFTFFSLLLYNYKPKLNQ
ncbi:MAG: O-antigen ligase family protein [Flavobacteriaceae bacterium]|nr:O-antigen ligase family protein [Flavobacteriaceae bacterium]